MDHMHLGLPLYTDSATMHVMCYDFLILVQCYFPARHVHSMKQYKLQN